jgi:gamma-glutamylcysteine synthetase
VVPAVVVRNTVSSTRLCGRGALAARRVRAVAREGGRLDASQVVDVGVDPFGELREVLPDLDPFDDAQCFVTGCERCVRWLRAAPNRPAFRVARVASDNGMSGDADMTAAIEAPTEHRAG